MRTIRECPVVVVGGAGFLGSHLVNHLIDDRNCDVLVLDNLTSGRREFIHPKAKFEHCDVTGSEPFLRSLMYQHKTRFCFNYSAIPYIPISFERPVYTCDVNFMGAMKVINAAQEIGVEGILQVSSAEIYGGYSHETQDTPGLKLDETSRVNPHSSYGVAKSAVDSAVQVRWREAKTPCIALRQFNCIGEWETHPYVVTTIISQVSKFWDNVKEESHSTWRTMNTPTIKLGNDSFRDFQYAGDAVRMATELLEKGEFGAVYNMGSETGMKIYDLAQLIGKLMEFDGVVIKQDPARVRPWEIWWLQSDNSKLYSIIEARPTVSLEEALRRTIKSFQEGGNKWCWE